MAEDQEFLHYVTTRSPVRKTASRQVLSLVRCRNVFPTFEQSLQVIHAYQQRSETNKNCKRRRESKPACSLIERGLEVSKACRSYMPTSKEAKQTRTASGEENPSLHAVSSSAVWRSRRPAGHTCLPAKKQNKQKLQAAMRSCMPSRRAPSGGLQIAVAFCPVQEHQSLQHEVAETSHQNFEHELARRDIPRVQSKRTKASSTNLQKETSHQNLVQFGNPEATEAFCMRLSAYETTVLENTSLAQALRRLRLYSTF